MSNCSRDPKKLSQQHQPVCFKSNMCNNEETEVCCCFTFTPSSMSSAGRKMTVKMMTGSHSHGILHETKHLCHHKHPMTHLVHHTKYHRAVQTNQVGTPVKVVTLYSDRLSHESKFGRTLREPVSMFYKGPIHPSIKIKSQTQQFCSSFTASEAPDTMLI